jgi:hypothetical protein
MRVFVSYSRAQFYFAEDLALALRERGVEAWFDVHQLQPGDDWAHGTEAAIRSAYSVLLVASRQALVSDHVRSELAIAQERGIPIVVVRADRAALPHALEGAPVFSVWRGFDRKLGRLVDALTGGSIRPVGGGPPAVVIVVPLALLSISGYWVWLSL